MDVEFKPYNVKRRFETKEKEILKLKADKESTMKLMKAEKEHEMQELSTEMKKTNKKNTAKLQSKIKALQHTLQVKDTTIRKKKQGTQITAANNWNDVMHPDNMYIKHS